MIKAILWDLDGTLVDSEPCHAQAFDRALSDLGIDIPKSAHDDLLGSSEAEVHQYVVNLGAELNLTDWGDLKWRFYKEGAVEIRQREDIHDLLSQNRHLAMAVVSNSSRRIVDLNLEVSGLASTLAISVSRDDVKIGKPAPDGYLLAAAKLGVEPAACVVVEDSLTGIRAGLAAGCQTIYAPQAPICAEAIPDGVRYLPPTGAPGMTLDLILQKDL